MSLDEEDRDMAITSKIDLHGVPEIWANKFLIEDAGGNCVRIVACIQRNGDLLPVGSIVIPAIEAIRTSDLIRTSALRILSRSSEVH